MLRGGEVVRERPRRVQPTSCVLRDRGKTALNELQFFEHDLCCGQSLADQHGTSANRFRAHSCLSSSPPGVALPLQAKQYEGQFEKMWSDFRVNVV